MAGTPTERFNPYSRDGFQRRLAHETPSQIVKLLSRQPPTDSKFKEADQSVEARSESTEYVMNTPERRSPVRLSKTNTRFKSYNASVLEDQRHIHMFRKRNRHNELADDALSVITELTTDKYSRFDRLFQTIEEPLQERTPLLPSQRHEPIDQSADLITEKVNIEQTAPIFEEASPSRQHQQTQELERDTLMDIDSSFYEGGGGNDDAPIENTQRSLFHDIRLATQETGYGNTQKSMFHEITLATQEIPEKRELSSPRLQAQTQTQTNTQTQEPPIQPSSPIAAQSLMALHSPSLPQPSASPPVIETQHDTFEEDLRRAQENMIDDNDYYGGGFEEDYDDEGLNQENEGIEGNFRGDAGDDGTRLNRFINEQSTSRSKDSALFDADDNSLSAPISTNIRKPVEPRNKVVVQGDSFISKLMDKPPTSGLNAISTAQVKSLFDGYLGFNKLISMPVGRYAQLRSLFFKQMLDDLKSYKENQPDDLQDEITPEDMILLMKRQKNITDRQSLEAVAHKYLPKEYSDLISQSALAYNRLYPAAMRGNPDDSFNDDEYEYDDE
ncbi:hypothetical protein MAM1_0158c06851 [Mucor ambiguus]|uniref:CENP-T/Histone H4 histone fold domain-containing protein n=1 Tax=Mucor ambiguus TaxID=91626 RepID=A0A0C9MIX7_9FUNG|nr:hypothetical protein MAM1_0158c06851 [Mucor ambiguus]